MSLGSGPVQRPLTTGFPKITLLRIALTVLLCETGVVAMILVCPIAALPRGEVYRLGTDPPIAVFHTDDGEVYAVDDTCTYQDASLADGRLEGGQMECPLHASRFDLRTGRVDGPPAKLPLRTHRVIVEDGTVYVVPSPEPPGPRPGVRAGTAGSAGVEAR